MADRPALELTFTPGACPDCGTRRVALPPEPVAVPQDIDLSARDFEGFRQLMLESLVLDNPDRERWSEADLEVALVELLAAALDRMSHSIDALFAERFLRTARWPRSVVRLLTMIDGVDPAIAALRGLMRKDELEGFGFDDISKAPADVLFGVLETHPQLIEITKVAALDGVNRIESCISLDDLHAQLEAVPLFSQVQVRYTTEGGIAIYEGSILLLDSSWRLHSKIGDLGEAGNDFVEYFKIARGSLLLPAGDALTLGSILEDLSDDDIKQTSIRSAVMHLLTPLLPLSTRLRLIGGKRAGIYMRLCVEVDQNYFRSEVEIAVREQLSARPGGLFEQVNFGFGQPLYLSDLQEALSSLAGVTGVIISHLQLVGDPGSEAGATGILTPPPNRALTLDADNAGPETGYYLLKMSGGLNG